MARSGKYLYYTKNSTIYCTPLYDSISCFSCITGYSTALKLCSNKVTYYMPITRCTDNLTSNCYLRFGDCYFPGGNGFNFYYYVEHDKIQADHYGRCVKEAYGNPKYLTAPIAIKSENGLASGSNANTYPIPVGCMPYKDEYFSCSSLTDSLVKFESSTGTLHGYVCKKGNGTFTVRACACQYVRTGEQPILNIYACHSGTGYYPTAYIIVCCICLTPYRYKVTYNNY